LYSKGLERKKKGKTYNEHSIQGRKTKKRKRVPPKATERTGKLHPQNRSLDVVTVPAPTGIPMERKSEVIDVPDRILPRGRRY